MQPDYLLIISERGSKLKSESRIAVGVGQLSLLSPPPHHLSVEVDVAKRLKLPGIRGLLHGRQRWGGFR